MTNTLSARTVATILAQVNREALTDGRCDCRNCLLSHAYHEVMDEAERAIIDASGPGSLNEKLHKHLFPKG